MNTEMIKVFLVGGAVRDFLIGKKSKDLDFVVTANSFDEMKEFVKGLGCRICQEAEKYGTIRAIHPVHGGVDFALPRKDENCDGRHCTTVPTTSIVEDMARRDFTMNAIAVECDRNLNPDFGSMIDPFDGVGAINRKEIAFVGNAQQRIAEDSLRVLRAIRFSVTMGFEMTEETAEAVRMATVGAEVSSDRIFTEMNKMATVDNVAMVAAMVKSEKIGLFSRVKTVFSGK